MSETENPHGEAYWDEYANELRCIKCGRKRNEENECVV